MVNKLGDKYKWVVLLGCTLCMMVYFGIVNNCYSIYIIPVCEEFGFSRASYNLCQTINSLGVAFCSLVSVKIFNKFGVLKVLRLSCTVMLFSYTLNAFSNSLAFFYATHLVTGIMMGLNCTVPNSIIIKQWFPDNMGTAIGVASMGSGIGGMVFTQFAKYLLANYSWRTTFLVFGLFMGFCGCLSSYVLIKPNPNYHPAVTEMSQTSESASGASLSKAPIPLGRTLIIMVFIAMGHIANNAISYTINPYIQDLGYGLATASNMFSISMAVFAFGKFFYGYCADRIGIKNCTMISYVVMFTGSIFMALMSRFGIGMLMFGPVLLGICMGSPFFSTGIPLMPNAICDSSYSDRVLGMLVAGQSFGAAVYPFLSGKVYDVFGSYVPFFILTAVFCVPAGIGLNYFYKHKA